jgi:outer membrane protein assembly factor BamB
VNLTDQLLAGLAFATLLTAAPVFAATDGSGLKIVDRIAAGGEGGWDYVSIDQAARKLYITRGASIMSVDADTGQVKLGLAVTSRSHQVVPINGGAELLVTNGGDATATILDAATGKVRISTKVSAGPDAAILEPTTGLVMVMGHKSGNVDLIDPKTGASAGSITVGGTLEFAAADGNGKAFVNVEDKGEVVAIDMKTRRVVGHYKMAGCEEPTGLAYLAPNNLLLAACGNGVAEFVSPDTGAVVQSLKIGAGSDAAFYDDVRKLAYVPSGATGTLTVITVEGQTAKIIDTIKTAKGARLGMVDTKTGKVYLPAAKFAPPATAGGWPTVVPGSFELLVVGK